MKKKAKNLVLLGITTSVIATSGIIQNIKPLKIKLEENKILGYNHNPASALDNVFIEDGMTILPFIYENPDEIMTRDRITEEFRKAGMTIKNISTGNKIGTGTEITVNENDNVYTLLIYGDINADGLVDIDDAVDLITSVRFQETKGLQGIYYKAGNVDATLEEVDISDAVELISFVRGLKNIPVVEPESLKEKDSITSIEMGSQPSKTKYNFGETTINPDGATIKIHWQSGTTTTTAIVPGMLGEYDLSTEGSHTIPVTYGGYSTSFQITVLDKISALEITNSGRDSNVTETVGGYKTDSNQEFILGTIQSKGNDTTSTLTADMVTINITADDEEIRDCLTIEKVVNNGNILLKGKATKTGTYNVTASISYGEQPVELTFTIVAAKSEKLGRVILDTTGIENTKLKVGDNLKLEVKVLNIHGEDISPEAISFVNKPTGINIIKLDESGTPIVSDTSSLKVKFIEISTTLETEQEVKFKVKATGKGNNNAVETEITLQIQAAPVLTSVTVDGNNVPLYTEEKENTKLDDAGNIYTVLGVNFLDQTGANMEILASNVKVVDEEALNTLTMQKGEIAIVLPSVTLKKIGGTSAKAGAGLLAKLYDLSGTETTTSAVEQLGVAYRIDLSGREVVLSSIEGKKIKVVNHNKNTISEIPLSIVYKALANIRISEAGSQNVTKNTTSGTYEVELNKEFILGTITVGENEGPLTPDMLVTEENKDGITISYEYNDAGQIVIKGTATKTGIYTVKPIAGDVQSKTTMIVEAKETPKIPTVTDIELSNTNVEIGEVTASTLKVVTDLTPEGETIKVRDIKLDYDTNKLEVKLTGENGLEIPSEQKLKDVKGLEISAKTNTEEDIDISITIFEGAENEKTLAKKVSVYKPIPRFIEVDNTVALSKSEYTVVAVKAYADAEKKKPVTLKYNMIELYMDGITTEVENKLYLTIPDIDASKSGKVKKKEVIKHNLQDKDSNVINLGDETEVAYIGFKAEIPDGFTVEDAALNGVDITLKSTATGGKTKTITTSYTAP